MNDTTRSWLLALILLATVAGIANAGNTTDKLAGATSSGDSAAPAQPRTSTTVLPARTNNAWELTPFELKGLDGKPHRLEEWKGQVILLNFWASWCGPCLSEIKDLVRYQAQYGPRGLQILGLGIDKQRKLANVKRSLGINYPVLIVEPFGSGKLLAQWGNDKGFIPYTVVIARDGRLKYIHRGELDWDAFAEFVLPLLAPDPETPASNEPDIKT